MRSPLGNLVVTSGFGMRIHPVKKTRSFHNGVDLKAKDGTVIRAPFKGTVFFNNHPTGGLQVIIKHEGGLRMGFAHLSRIADGLKQGQTVEESSIIGYSGHSGSVTGPHVHMTASIPDVDRPGYYKFFDPTIIEFEV